MASGRTTCTTAPTVAAKNAKILQGNPVTTSGIRDATTARQFLEVRGYCAKDQRIDVSLLATVALQLSLEKFNAQGAHDVLRALSFLLEIQYKNDLTKRIAESVLQKVDEGVKQIPAVEALEAAATECGDAARKAKVALVEFKDDCQDLSRKLSEAADEISLAIPAAVEEANSIERNSRPTGPSRNYANAVAQPWTQGPIQRNMMTPQMRNQQILVDQAPGVTSNGLQDMSEKELVSKANMALAMLAAEVEGVPEEGEFVGATKLQHGGILFRMNSEEGAEWIRKEGKEGFLAKMGGTSVVKERTATVVVEYVPVTFEPEVEGALREVEQVSGLKEGSIVRATYIKPKHRRAPGQKVAFAIFTFHYLDDANHVLCHGMLIENKQVWGHKKYPEPRRCYKCQAIGVTHIASECKAEHDTCARCGGNHRASVCNVTDESKFNCVNCEGLGHGPGNRYCPAMEKAAMELLRQSPTNRLQYFVTNDPMTWEQDEHPVELYSNPQDATWVNSDGTYGGGWTEVRGKKGKGTGRLAGGLVGEGGGKTYQVGARGPDNGYKRVGGRGATRWEGDGMRQTELQMANMELPGGGEQANAMSSGDNNPKPNV